MQGMPYKIPVVEKDFVFAAISEELGGNFCPVCASDLSGVFSSVYDDCSADGGGFL